LGPRRNFENYILYQVLTVLMATRMFCILYGEF
jgi:hypothetical protein